MFHTFNQKYTKTKKLLGLAAFIIYLIVSIIGMLYFVVFGVVMDGRKLCWKLVVALRKEGRLSTLLTFT